MPGSTNAGDTVEEVICKSVTNGLFLRILMIPMNHRTPQKRIAVLTTAIGQMLRLLRAWRNLLIWKVYVRGRLLAKRGLDLSLAISALMLLAPLFAIVAMLIWAGDRGPVLYWQRRVGRDGVEFDFPKFRSMAVDSEALRERLQKTNQHGAQGVTFKMRHDPRITRIGRFIRRYSIDELPQLWCIVKGEMSLVGPRPPLPAEVARYSLADRQRLCVAPGLTCIWQVSGRSEIPFERQVLLDLEYIRNRSMRTDLMLLWKTIPAVIRGRGAY
jgi:lipopolysaccharide/colanic/teichoic acid biosynthesis glycosyltransferase